MATKRGGEPVPASVYPSEYLLSPALEGYAEFLEGRISLVKHHELDLLGAESGQRVLDLGCGRGEVVAELQRRGAVAVGLDYAPAAVEIAAKLIGEGARVVRADATKLPFADASFDRVLMGDVIEHLTWPLGVQTLREVRRILAPGGTALLHTAPNRWFVAVVMPVLRPAMRLARRNEVVERLADYDRLRGTMHPNELSPFGLKRLLREAGISAQTWVDRDVLRSGSSAWTSGIAQSGLVRGLGAVVGRWPFRLVFGNDLYAVWTTPRP